MFGSVDGWKGLACIFMCDFIIFIFFFPIPELKLPSDNQAEQIATDSFAFE